MVWHGQWKCVYYPPPHNIPTTTAAAAKSGNYYKTDFNVVRQQQKQRIRTHDTDNDISKKNEFYPIESLGHEMFPR